MGAEEGDQFRLFFFLIIILRTERCGGEEGREGGKRKREGAASLYIVVPSSRTIRPTPYQVISLLLVSRYHYVCSYQGKRKTRGGKDEKGKKKEKKKGKIGWLIMNGKYLPGLETSTQPCKRRPLWKGR
jgi:hypothetical protein